MRDTDYSAHIRERQAKIPRALAAEKFDALVISSGASARYFADDQDVPFWPNPHFAHWLPLAEPHALLILRTDAKPLLVRVVPDDFWEEHASLSDAFWKDEFDLLEVKSEADAWKAAGDLKRAAYMGEMPAAAAAAGVTERGINPLSLIARLDFERTYKTGYEIECLSRANERAAAGHVAARDAFMGGASELAIHHAYLRAIECTEAELPYDTVVALDEKAAILHYQNKRRGKSGEGRGNVLLLDAGAPCNGYGSDITRTYLTTNADPLFIELVAGVERVQQELCAALKPGIAYADFHKSAHAKLGTLLHELGISTVPGDEAVEQGITKTFFPHGIGHMLGVQVHDVGGKEKEAAAQADYPMLRATRVAEENHVFTVEPGIYFIPLLLKEQKEGPVSSALNWSLINRLAPFGGVRIEDDVLITKDGNRNLTREFLP